MTDEKRRLYGTVEISKLLNFHQTTIAKWIDSCKLQSFKTIGGHRKVESKELLRFLRDNNIPIPVDLVAEQASILVIDDDEDFVEMMKLRLEEKYPNLQIRSTSDEVDALINIGQSPPTLIVLDIFMPRVDGAEVYKHVKGSQLGKDIHFILISGRDVSTLPNFNRSLFEQVPFFKKPIDFPAFENAIDKVIQKL